ncbi:recombinase family protein [Gordonia desulfuricans]|uniref:Recombinase family protein n=1 Tax=Gordonia desulfuricans TaxID=89051 RepID=A0A7K3LQB1_9ACTN|nr:recombinase family protein [Gordonia desulfuricans]NDK90408.1 recombinase family protein [Gordonia desulfuricans]
MTGQRVGYVRVSTAEQNEARQLDDVELDRVFTDKASGRDRQRPELEKLLDFVRDGDTVYVHSLDRLGRNVDDLRDLITELTGQGVEVRIVKQGLTFTSDDTSPMNRLMLTMLGAFAEFELAMIRERQAEGIAKAKAAGKYRGRNAALTPEQVEEIAQRHAGGAGEGITALATEYGVSRQTVYNYLNRGRLDITGLLE